MTTDRNTPSRAGYLFEGPVAADTVIPAGALVAIDASGNFVPGATATTLIGIGRAQARADNAGGSAGDVTVRVESGTFRWDNSESDDAIGRAEIGSACYIVDDRTVAKTSGTSTRSRAGVVVDIDSLGVWVDMGVHKLAAPAGALLAASNLSDVAAPATALANVGGAPGLGAPTITVGSQSDDVINVAVQLKTPGGTNLAVPAAVLAYLSDDDAGDGLIATAHSGAVAVGTDGVAIPLTAKKVFVLVSDADGQVDLDIEEAGAKTAYLVLVLPGGRLAVSDAITHA